MFEIKNLKKPVQKAPPSKISNAFKNAMDDDDTSNQSRPKIAHLGTQIAQVSYQKVLDETSKVMLEDPEVYSYDAHYDEINQKRQEVEQQKKQKVQAGSRYIANLKATAEKRKVEQSMVYEKIAEKELAREGGPSGDKYVTSSYKRMMEEARKFKQEDEAKEEYNKLHGAENKDNMHGLYKDLYKQDIFMGGFRPDLATMMKQPKAETPQEEAQRKPIETAPQKVQETKEEKQQAAKPVPVGPEGEQKELTQSQKESKIRDKSRSRSRSRSRSKSPTSVTAFREEQKTQKEPEKEKEKELSKEEKLKLLKERYQQRKLNQAAGPQPEQA